MRQEEGSTAPATGLGEDTEDKQPPEPSQLETKWPLVALVLGTLGAVGANYFLGDSTKTALFFVLLLLIAPAEWIIRARKISLDFIKHGPQIVGYTREIVPLLPDIGWSIIPLLDNLDVIAPHIDTIMKHKNALVPHMPLLLSRLDKLLPHIDKLVAKADFLVPHVDVLLPYLDQLLEHVEDIWPFVDDIEPFVNELCIVFEVDGWEDLLPYMDQIVPFLPLLAPHSKELSDNFEEMREHLPILVRNIDNLAPNIDGTMPVLDRLLPLAGLLPIADKLKLLRSRKFCKALPKIARILPKQKAKGKLQRRRSFSADAKLG